LLFELIREPLSVRKESALPRERKERAENGDDQRENGRQDHFGPHPGDGMDLRVCEQPFGADKADGRNDQQRYAELDPRSGTV
jgi:hypothetical protein